MPSVVAWPFAVDSNGEAYPAGLVGVYSNFVYNESAATFNQRLIAVPDTLPVGYTPRMERDHNRAPADSSKTPNRIGQSSPFEIVNYGAFSGNTGDHCWGEDAAVYTGGSITPCPRIRTAQALTNYRFMPENLGDSAGVAIGSKAGGSHTAFNGLFSSQGLRYLRIVCDFTGYDANYTKCRITVGHFGDANTKVTNPGVTGGQYPALPSTIWYQQETLAGGTLDTGYVYGGWSFPLGQRGDIAIYPEIFDSSAGLWKVFRPLEVSPFAYSFYWQRRLDLPMPWTFSGEGGLIAPGGVVPGVIPGY
jgi:hypothetical protein